MDKAGYFADDYCWNVLMPEVRAGKRSKKIALVFDPTSLLKYPLVARCDTRSFHGNNETASHQAPSPCDMAEIFTFFLC